MISEETKNSLTPRIKKIEGQIRGISKMIEKRDYCMNIMQQIAAVNGALKSLNAILLENHLNTCVKDAMQSDNKKQIEIKIKELVDIYRKF